METSEMIECDRAGIFKAKPVGYALTKGEGSWGVEIDWLLTDILNGSEFVPFNYGMGAEGTLWFIKKDGTFNDKAVETLRDVLGWDGDTDSIENGTWVVPPAQVTIKSDTYNNKTRYRVEWVKPIDFAPKGKCSSEDVNGLKSAFGSQLRAVFGQKSHSASRPNGSPPPIPPRPTTLPPIPPKPVVTHTREQAWSAFSTSAAKVVPPLSNDKIGSEWFRICALVIPGKTEDLFTSDDWAKMTAEAPAMIVPF